MKRYGAAIASLLLVGCGETSSLDASVDAFDVQVDANGDSAIDQSTDPVDVEVGLDAQPDVPDDAVNPSTLQVSNATGMASMNVAKYGKNLDGTIRIEAYAQNGSDCPTQDSPTPAQTLIIASLPDAAGSAQMLSFVLLDFAGDLGSEPIYRGEGSADDLNIMAQEVTFRFDGTFDGGAANGDVVAAYCPSLDEV